MPGIQEIMNAVANATPQNKTQLNTRKRRQESRTDGMRMHNKRVSPVSRGQRTLASGISGLGVPEPHIPEDYLAERSGVGTAIRNILDLPTPEEQMIHENTAKREEENRRDSIVAGKTRTQGLNEEPAEQPLTRQEEDRLNAIEAGKKRTEELANQTTQGSGPGLGAVLGFLTGKQPSETESEQLQGAGTESSNGEPEAEAETPMTNTEKRNLENRQNGIANAPRTKREQSQRMEELATQEEQGRLVDEQIRARAEREPSRQLYGGIEASTARRAEEEAAIADAEHNRALDTQWDEQAEELYNQYLSYGASPEEAEYYAKLNSAMKYSPEAEEYDRQVQQMRDVYNQKNWDEKNDIDLRGSQKALADQRNQNAGERLGLTAPGSQGNMKRIWDPEVGDFVYVEDNSNTESSNTGNPSSNPSSAEDQKAGNGNDTKHFGLEDMPEQYWGDPQGYQNMNFDRYWNDALNEWGLNEIDALQGGNRAFWKYVTEDNPTTAQFYAPEIEAAGGFDKWWKERMETGSLPIADLLYSEDDELPDWETFADTYPIRTQRQANQYADTLVNAGLYMPDLLLDDDELAALGAMYDMSFDDMDDFYRAVASDERVRNDAIKALAYELKLNGDQNKRNNIAGLTLKDYQNLIGS